MVMMFVALVFVAPVFAGAKLDIDGESSIDFGYRVQALTIVADGLDKDGDAVKQVDWKVRRARLRVAGTINKYASAFIQTEVGPGSGSGQDARVIDAWINMKKDNWTQLIMGLNMAPASRQNLTSSGALMAIDRPGQAYKSLAWGARMLRTFSNSTVSGTDSGLRVGSAVRDLGTTLFGSGKVGDNASFKYYVGVYDGVNASSGSGTSLLANAENTPHIGARGQINFFDAESGYYNSSTYLGKKKTVAIGASYDAQTDVSVVGTTAAPEMVDYTFFSVDGFMEWPAGEGSVTVEAAWSMLDFGDVGGAFDASQGTGFYAQAGFYQNDWQPWGMFETWSSDGAGGTGNVDQFRIGLTRYLKGHNANIKAGFESTTSDVPILGTEDTTNAMVLGMYVTY